VLSKESTGTTLPLPLHGVITQNPKEKSLKVYRNYRENPKYNGLRVFFEKSVEEKALT
jgi:hypothetical protein